MKRVGSDACSFLGTVRFNCLQSHGTHWPDTAVVVFRKLRKGLFEGLFFL